jgi:hypothetical protein
MLDDTIVADLSLASVTGPTHFLVEPLEPEEVPFRTLPGREVWVVLETDRLGPLNAPLRKPGKEFDTKNQQKQKGHVPHCKDHFEMNDHCYPSVPARSVTSTNRTSLGSSSVVCATP